MATATGQKLASGALAGGSITTIYMVTSAKKGYVRVLVGNIHASTNYSVLFTLATQSLCNMTALAGQPMEVIWEGWCNGGELVRLTSSGSTDITYHVDGPLED